PGVSSTRSTPSPSAPSDCRPEPPTEPVRAGPARTGPARTGPARTGPADPKENRGPPSLPPLPRMSAVEAALAARLGGPVSNLARLSGGASRETWSFDAGGRPLILRREQPGSLDTSAMAREAALLVSAADAGVPVPALVDHGDDLAGAPFLIMERLSGETIPRRLLRDERFADVRGRLARELGEILARLH